MAKKIKNMNKKELIEHAKSLGIKINGDMTKVDIMAACTFPKPESPILSETPVIDGMQANAPVEEPVEKEPVPEPPAGPEAAKTVWAQQLVVCMGCKGRYESSIMKSCNCKGAPAYCPACLSAGTCHRCGKKI